MRGFARLGSWLSVVLVAASGVSAAQDPEIGATPRAVFSSRSDLVVLHATVTDRRGAFVGGLPRDAFAVREDGRLQEIAFFAEQDAPVTVGLVLDNSGSMLETRSLLLSAVQAFAQASHPADEFFALTFNERVRPVLPDEAPFTSDPVVLREALSAALTARGRTALHDAVLAGLAALDGGAHARKVLVVVADGGDNASRATFEAVLARARASNVVIYTVAIADPLNWDADPGRLRRLAKATGGLAYEPPDVEELEEALTRISRDIRSSYTLAYEPADGAHDGLRRIEVRVRASDGRRLVARTRDGYLVERVPDRDRAGQPSPGTGAGPGRESVP
jgi:VWFA-related protein